MASLNYPIEMVSGVPVVAAPAEIDISNADWLDAVLREAAASGHATLVVDMTATQFCTSSGVGVLVQAHKRAVADGGELRLVRPASAMVLRKFALAGIDRVIPTFPSLDEAVEPAPATAPPATAAPAAARQARDAHRRGPATARPRRHNQRRLNGYPALVPGSCRGLYHTDWQPASRSPPSGGPRGSAPGAPRGPG